MSDPIQTAIADVTQWFQGVEAKAVKAWDAFLADIVYLRHEAGVIAAAIEKADPALQAQVQNLLTVAEASAQALAAKTGTSLQTFVADGIDAAEQRSANAIQKVTGNSPLGIAGSALLTAGLTDLGSTIQHIETVGFAKAVSGLLQAAGLSTPAEAPAPPASPGA